MSDLAMGGRGSFDMGRVIERTFGVIGANFATLFGMSLVLSALPQALLALATPVDPVRMFDFAPAAVAAWLATVVGSYVLQASVVHASIADLNGGKASFADSLRTGLNNFLPVLGISILMGLGLAVGFILLIVPGLIMLTAWVVAVPAQVVEKTGVIQSFSRSADLTRGNRWAIFGLLFVYLILAMIIGGIGGAIIGGVSLATGDTAMNVLRVIFTPLVSAVSAMIGASGVAAVYYELRSKKEGVAPQDLAAVFD